MERTRSTPLRGRWHDPAQRRLDGGRVRCTITKYELMRILAAHRVLQRARSRVWPDERVNLEPSSHWCSNRPRLPESAQNSSHPTNLYFAEARSRVWLPLLCGFQLQSSGDTQREKVSAFLFGKIFRYALPVSAGMKRIHTCQRPSHHAH
jgi:hypothetical protein